MQWFKCAFEEASLMEAEEELGQAGAFQVMKVIRNALALDVKRLDEKIVARMANVKIDRARRLLPYAERFLKSTLKLYKNVQESELISENVEETKEILENLPESFEILENLSDFNASNPHGSTRDLDKSRKDKSRDYSTGSVEPKKTISIDSAAKQKKATQAPDEYPVDEQLKNWLDKKSYPSEWAETEIEKCLRWHKKEGKPRKDWHLTMVDWIDRAQEEYKSFTKWKQRTAQSSYEANSAPRGTIIV